MEKHITFVQDNVITLYGRVHQENLESGMKEFFAGDDFKRAFRTMNRSDLVLLTRSNTHSVLAFTFPTGERIKYITNCEIPKSWPVVDTVKTAIGTLSLSTIGSCNIVSISGEPKQLANNDVVVVENTIPRTVYYISSNSTYKAQIFDNEKLGPVICLEEHIIHADELPDFYRKLTISTI